MIAKSLAPRPRPRAPGAVILAVAGPMLACGTKTVFEPWPDDVPSDAAAEVADTTFVPSDANPPDAGSSPSDAGAPDISDAASCWVQAPTACPEPAPRYGDVAPIIAQRCVVACHSGAADGPWPLTDYEHVADWQDVVRADLLNCSMPPVDAGVGMTGDEKLTILTWIRCGAPP